MNTQINLLAQWLGRTQSRVLADKATKAELEKRASLILEHAQKTGWVRQYGDCAIFLFLKPREPRVRGERVFFYAYKKSQRSKAIAWIKTQIQNCKAPLHTRISVLPRDVKVLEKTLQKKGFLIRYEVQFGLTKVALRELTRKKKPAESLHQLGLKLRPLQTRDVAEAIRLQKKVFSAQPEHGNHSHTRGQLKRDQKEYTDTLRKKQGLILGVFREKKLLGFMATFIHATAGSKTRSAGITLCLDPSIQGMGVSKTGYLHLLRFLQKQKVKKFYGGTSQPAVKGLGKLMKRRVEDVLFLKSRL